MKNLIFFAALMVLAGCMGPQGAPNRPPPEASADPAAQNHAIWCDGLMPSGYCIVPEAK